MPQVRSIDRTRDLPISLSLSLETIRLLLRGLDMGVNDYIVRLIEAQELLAGAHAGQA